jgi:hypothetical protein
MAEQQGPESEAVAPRRGGAGRWRRRAPIVAGAAGGVALVAVLAFLAWPEPPGQVVFSVQPDDASVWLFGDEGRYQIEPEAGALTAALPSGIHRAEVEREGYQSHEFDFEVESGETRTVEVVLERAVGRVVIEVKPTTAEVELTAGEEEAETRSLALTAGRWEGTLEVGSYVARIDAPGYYEESEPFEVREDEPTAVAVSLRPIPIATTRERTVVVPGYYGPGPIYAPYGPRIVVRPPVGAGPPVPRAPRVPGPPVPRAPRVPGPPVPGPGLPGPGLPGVPHPPVP